MHKFTWLCLLLVISTVSACEKTKPAGEAQDHKDGDGHEHKAGDGHEHKDEGKTKK